VIELRVHGVSGTPPEAILDDPHPKRVDGDEASGFYRPGADDGDRFTEEAYAWGGLTSGSPMRALWVLLAPFALVNAAAAMHRRSARLASALMRLFALSLTVTLVGASYIVSADLLAWQCGSDNACIERHAYTRFLAWEIFDSPGRRLAASLLLPVAVISVLWALARSTWQRAEAFVPEMTVMPLVKETPFDDPELWDGRARGRLLRHLHVAVAVASVAALLSYALVRTAGTAQFAFAQAVAVLVGVAVLSLEDVPPHVDRIRVVMSWVALALAWLSLLGAAWAAWREPEFTSQPAQLPGVDRSVTYLFAGQVLAVALLLVVSRWPAASMSLVALALGAAFSAGVVVQGADFLGDPDTRALVLPEGIAWASRGTAVILGLGVVALLLFGLSVAWDHLRHPEPPDPIARRTRAAKRTDDIPRFTAMVMAVLAPIIVGGIAIVIAIDLGWADELRADTSGAAWRGLTVVGSRSIALFAIGLMLLARASYRNRAMRRRVGIVWDVATFWPRHAHPLAPPCYAERAVPELGQRIAYLTAGDPRVDDPVFKAKSVIVSAHSQGSVIAAAALLRQGQAVSRVALVTYGSPLDRLYGRYFPAYFNPDTMDALARRLDQRWVNLWRVTDPIGGPVRASAHDWEVPLGTPLEGHSNYPRESWYRDALTQSEFALTGRLYA
jgi:hypothetical protein